jgi:hypothetical protein
LLPPQLVHALDHHEQRESHKQEADHIIYEQPEIDGGLAGLSRLRERVVVLPVQGDEHVGEIDAAGDHSERGMTVSSTSDFTIVENAAPMMMPTAMSMTLPLSANSLNSFSIGALL